MEILYEKLSLVVVYVDGKTYFTVQQTDKEYADGPCDGCAGRGDKLLCHAFPPSCLTLPTVRGFDIVWREFK